jgi:glutathione synthase/RimK-type ligase-like ATP-grasp enzyme
MNNVKILPYKAASNSASDLASAMGVKRLKQMHSRWGGRGGVVINWGNSTPPESAPWVGTARVINPFEAVEIASNKLKYYEAVSDICPELEYTTTRSVAEEWLAANHSVVERHLMRASGGRGINLVRPGENLTQAPLYVKYLKKVKEYRAHVIFGEVVHVVEKRVRSGSEGNNFQIRNHDSGWVFCQEDVNISDEGKAVAALAVDACGLHFGAVDLLYNSQYERYTPLEINTAPGLEGSTVERYAGTFTNLFERGILDGSQQRNIQVALA